MIHVFIAHASFGSCDIAEGFTTIREAQLSAESAVKDAGKGWYGGVAKKDDDARFGMLLFLYRNGSWECFE